MVGGTAMRKIQAHHVDTGTDNGIQYPRPVGGGA
jgi:hypothetical protein